MWTWDITWLNVIADPKLTTHQHKLKSSFLKSILLQKQELKDLERHSVEETLNNLLDQVTAKLLI